MPTEDRPPRHVRIPTVAWRLISDAATKSGKHRAELLRTGSFSESILRIVCRGETCDEDISSVHAAGDEIIPAVKRARQVIESR